jgi:hypothetical protein
MQQANNLTVEQARHYEAGRKMITEAAWSIFCGLMFGLAFGFGWWLLN